MNDADFKEFMKQQMSEQVVSYLIACGFDKPQSYAGLKFSGPEDCITLIQDFMRSSSAIFSDDEATVKQMYGLFWKNPSLFTVMPGHRAQIISFVREVETMLEEGASQQSLSKAEQVKKAKANSEREHGDALPRRFTKPEQIVSSVRDTLLKRAKDPMKATLVEGLHFKLYGFISTDGSPSAHMQCLNCMARVRLGHRRRSFSIGNFDRHWKICIKKVRHPPEETADELPIPEPCSVHVKQEPGDHLEGWDSQQEEGAANSSSESWETRHDPVQTSEEDDDDDDKV